MSEKPLIFKQMSAVMKDAGSIGKNKKNTMQNYNFRGIDDVYNALHGIMAKHKVFTTSKILDESSEERKTKNGGVLIYRILKIEFTFWAEDGSSVKSEVIGEGMDSGDKASNKGMAVGHKYALLQAFCIPTEERKDPEYESPSVTPRMPKRSTVNKALAGYDTIEQFDDYVALFVDLYGKIFEEPSGHKKELWKDLFASHKRRILKQNPFDANATPQGTFDKMANECSSIEDYYALCQFMDDNGLENQENADVITEKARQYQA